MVYLPLGVGHVYDAVRERTTRPATVSDATYSTVRLALMQINVLAGGRICDLDDRHPRPSSRVSKFTAASLMPSRIDCCNAVLHTQRTHTYILHTFPDFPFDSSRFGFAGSALGNRK